MTAGSTQALLLISCPRCGEELGVAPELERVGTERVERAVFVVECPSCHRERFELSLTRNATPVRDLLDRAADRLDHGRPQRRRRTRRR